MATIERKQCDVCGKPGREAKTYGVQVTGPGESDTNLCKTPLDLCKPCLARLYRFITRGTTPPVKRGT